MNQFVFWNVMIDVGFWTLLAKKKLEIYKLEAVDRPLIAKFKLENSNNKLALLTIDAFSFQNQNQQKMGCIEIKVEGKFLNTNTIEEFKTVDLSKEQQIIGQKVENDIINLIKGTNKIIMPNFRIYMFADLKKHVFSYTFLSSALAANNYSITKIQAASSYFQTSLKSLNSNIKSVMLKQQLTTFFVLRWINQTELEVSSFKKFIDEPQYQYIFANIDIVNYPGITGFHTSTIFYLFARLLETDIVTIERLKSIKILLIKDMITYNPTRQYTFKNSQVWTIDFSNSSIDKINKYISQPRKTLELDLKSFMDERSLAKQAVDLNIKLMKWRLLPRLDIPKIQSKKCLLFGAGTLGCQLARNLIGWGIKNITFVDYSKVSYSNPVRQTLYQYEDTIKGGKLKAIAAAQKLKKIYPEIKSQGYHLSIPMPGHFIRNNEHAEEIFKDLDILQKLVSQHDALFLLLDSRQARWLPTVLANKFDKACITVGLGFDTFMIVRHGVSPAVYDKQIHKQRLSCYFCNDIVTPQDTMKDRTLDQQCTVTRPGLSFSSAAYASQLYISLIHHQLEHRVWAHEDPSKLQKTDLGKLPHYLRGCMSQFEVGILYGRAFDQCVACSKMVLDIYNTNRNDFIVKVLNEPKFIHQVTGLQKQIQKWQKEQNWGIQIISDDEQEIE